MTLGTQIGLYRRKLNITQEALAQKLGVTNQAVSKWESDQCCPDVMLLPKLADIFEISIDMLFGREPAAAMELPWKNDNALHIVLFQGHRLMRGCAMQREVTIHYEGPARDIYSDFSVCCEDVSGNVSAGGDVNCDGVSGNVSAGEDVNCDEVSGNVSAGSDINCNDVDGNVSACGDVNCDDVAGDVNANGDVNCDDVNGSVTANGDISCNDVGGNVKADGDVDCGDVSGSIYTGGNIEWD